MDKNLQQLKRALQDNPQKVVELGEIIEKDFSSRADILLVLSEAYAAIGDSKNAQRIAKKCLTIKRMPISTVFALARHMMNIGMINEAATLSEKWFRASGMAIQFAAKALYTAINVCNWTLVNEITKKILEEYQNNGPKKVNETPRTHLLWCDDQVTNNEILNYYADTSYRSYEKKIKEIKPISGRKIRVGYMSSDYRNHPTAQLIKGLIREHDRDEFEIIAYDTGFDDKSAMRQETLSYFDQVVILFGLSNKEAIQKISDDELDIIVELNGLTAATKINLLAERPVPIQIAYLGFPGTVGGRFIDYIIADKYVVPDEYLHLYREKTIRIEKTYQLNDHLHEKDEDECEDVKGQNGFTTDAFVMGMFNNCNKVTESCWAVWMEILQKIPNGVLWILNPNPVAKKNLLKAAQKFGINRDRFVFAPRLSRSLHNKRLAACDIVLDPWPYGGHTTTTDAIYAGVPVLVKTGTNFSSRVSGGLMIAAGLPGWIVENEKEYIESAVKLYENPDLLIKTKKYLKENKSNLNLFNTTVKARQIESAYKKIIENRLAGLADQHINVGYKSNRL